MAKKQDYELLMTEGGAFFFGRILKNGTMSADSAPIDDDNLLKMFAAWFERHCRREQTDQLWMTAGDGAILVKFFTADDLRKAADKRGQTGARPQSAERKQSQPQAKNTAAKKTKKK